MQEFREVYPHVWKLTLPLPFELESVNVYLVAIDGGWMLIDTGMETDEAFEVLRNAMEQRGIAWREIRQILLTHMHPDHIGMSRRLLELSGAELAMHEVEFRHLQLVTGGGRRIPWLDRVYREAGVPAPLEEKMEAHFFAVRKNFHDLTPDHLYSGNVRIQTAIGPLEVIMASGHSPGLICLYSRERKVLFSADQMLERITPNISWHPDRDMLQEYLTSLEGLSGLDVDLILPGHYEPFSGHRAWIAKTGVHHRDRCGEILNAVRRTPQTAHQMVAELWRKKLSPINHHFAVFEVLAHLEHMQRRGEVRHRSNDGALEWHE
ncbi:MAG TPA: MBL fold metallo-hydrolase [Bryobacteraceae bacterium]|nr:MBL fold metallo-hydrolase [Bryobacteraceae bacterium]